MNDQLDFALTVTKQDYNTNDRLKFILSIIRWENGLNKRLKAEEKETKCDEMKMKASKTRNELKASDSSTYRLKTEERTKNGEERQKIFTESPTKMSQKRYGGISAWIFFTKTRFFIQNNWNA